jgi:type II secretory pathway pseudopilin PulG
MSHRARKNQLAKGFTLVEMGVVVMLLALTAAMVVPVLSRWQDSQDRAAFFVEFRNIFSSAREQAILTKTAQTVTYDGESFTTGFTDQDGNDNSSGRVRLPEGFEASRFSLAGQEAPPTEWQLTFYPDGSAEPAGIEIQDFQNQWFLTVDKLGHPRFGQGSMPDPSSQSWDAGDHEIRQ